MAGRNVPSRLQHCNQDERAFKLLEALEDPPSPDISFTQYISNLDATDAERTSVRSFVEGFIPTASYPTNAVFSKDGKQILILTGKGMVPANNMVLAGPE